MRPVVDANAGSGVLLVLPMPLVVRMLNRDSAITMRVAVAIAGAVPVRVSRPMRVKVSVARTVASVAGRRPGERVRPDGAAALGQGE
jgi:hypothetical protein